MNDAAQRILIVDDDPRVREVLREQLHDRYEVEDVANGSQAFGAMLRRRPDLIVLDIKLPGLGGEHVLKGIRTLDATIPVLAVTGSDNRAVVEEVLSQGACGYLLK